MAPLFGRGGLACRLGVLFLSAAGGAHWPIAIRCPSLGPVPSIGAHQPLTTLCPSSSSLSYLSLSTSLSFPLVGCANGAPRLSLFHCSVSTQRRVTHLVVVVVVGGRWLLMLCGCPDAPSGHHCPFPRQSTRPSKTTPPSPGHPLCRGPSKVHDLGEQVTGRG